MIQLSILPRRLLGAVLFISAPALAPALAIAAAAVPTEAHAQASTAVGQWNIEWELGRRVMNGDVEIIKATGVLTVRASGDSLLATIETKNRTDGRPIGAPVVLGGKATATGGVFSQVQQMRFNMNGDERTVDARVTWTLVAAGDALSGEIVREMPATMVPVGPTVPATLTGTRIKN